MNRQNVKKALGIPVNVSRKDLAETIIRFKLLFYIYALLIVIYFIFFILFKHQSQRALDSYFGNGFGISFSASLLENLYIFIFLGFGVTLTSVIVTVKTPEEHEFRRRVSALMNSRNVRGNEKVLNYLLTQISKLLFFNKSIRYVVNINAYEKERQIYTLTVSRWQVITNMCADKDFVSEKSKICITTDAKIDNSYGRIDFLGKIDAQNENVILQPIIDAVHNPDLIQLNAELNEIPLHIIVEQDKERGYKLVYTTYSSVCPKEEDSSWLFLQVADYTAYVEIQIVNNLKGGVTYDLRKIDKDGKTSYLAEGVEAIRGLEKNNKYILSYGLLPGESVEYYLYPMIG